jgi:hypothetical protein
VDERMEEALAEATAAVTEAQSGLRTALQALRAASDHLALSPVVEDAPDAV